MKYESTTKYLKADHQKIIKLYVVDKLSCQSIASIVNLSAGTITRILKYNNINLRRPSREGRKNKFYKPRKTFNTNKYKNLTIIEYRGKGEWLCKCDCGNTVLVRSNLIGRQNSCRKCMIGPNNPLWTGYKHITGSNIAHIRAEAKRRNIIFDITPQIMWDQWIIQEGKCALTGIQLQIDIYNKNRSTASLDRIDSSKGYTKDNIQWVHKTINIIKWHLSQDEFKQWCNLVTNHNK